MKKNNEVSKPEIRLKGGSDNIRGRVSNGRSDSNLGRVSEAGKTFGS
jgi:hypothetical protein